MKTLLLFACAGLVLGCVTPPEALPSGQWSQLFSGPHDDFVNAVALTGEGEVMVGGRISTDTGFVPLLRRYNAMGTELWSSAPEDDEVLALGTEASGSAWVLTAKQLLRYHPSGTVELKHALASEANGVALAVAPDGEVIVSATVLSASQPTRALIGRFARDGSERWSQVLSAGPDADVFAGSVAFTGDGKAVVRVTIVGKPSASPGQLLFSTGAAVAQFAADGRREWTAALGPVVDQLQQPLVVDSENRAWIALKRPTSCASEGCTEDPRALKVVGLDSSGQLFVERSFTTSSGLVAAAGLAFAKEGLIVVGDAYGAGDWDGHAFTAKGGTGLLLTLGLDLTVRSLRTLPVSPSGIATSDASLAIAGSVRGDVALEEQRLAAQAQESDGFVWSKALRSGE